MPDLFGIFTPVLADIQLHIGCNQISEIDCSILKGGPFRLPHRTAFEWFGLDACLAPVTLGSKNDNSNCLSVNPTGRAQTSINEERNDMSVRQPVSTVLVVFTLAGTVVVTHGQGLAGNRRIVRGTVLDPTRAVLADARVTARRDGGAAALSTVSGTNGEFSLAARAGQLHRSDRRAGLSRSIANRESHREWLCST